MNPHRLLAAALAAWTLCTSPALAAMAVSQTSMQVHVDGAVKRPGVYRVTAGGRLAEAIAAAGGPLPGARLTTLNLAERVSDGTHLHVPAATEAAPVKAAAPTYRKARRAAPAKARTTAPVDLNAASPAQLDTLPGVGPAMVGRILTVRKRLGRFKAIDELREVPGIGAKRLAKLRPLVVIR